MGIGGKVFC